jgi:acetyl esterase/lipase
MRFFFRKLLFSLLVTTNCFAAQAPWHFTPQDVNALHSKAADHKFFYGKDPLQFAELRLPEGQGPFPVAIVIHGGCWMSKFASAQNTAALSDALRNMGIATWNIEYRRADNPGGGWPGTFLDVADAADYLREIANQYSLDLNNVIAIGHSAGGHLALWLAMRSRLPEDSDLYMEHPLDLRGVISMGGVPDLKAFREQGKTTCDADVVGNLLGNAPDKIEERYLQASPYEMLPSGVPQILIYGAEEQSVPVAFGKSYLSKAKKKGDSVRLVVVENAAHHEYNVPNSITWNAVYSAVKKLLGQS